VRVLYSDTPHESPGCTREDGARVAPAVVVERRLLGVLPGTTPAPAGILGKLVVRELPGSFLAASEGDWARELTAAEDAFFIIEDDAVLVFRP
jgi:hypothetical protein